MSHLSYAGAVGHVRRAKAGGRLGVKDMLTAALTMSPGTHLSPLSAVRPATGGIVDGESASNQAWSGSCKRSPIGYRQGALDWTIFHALNGALRGDDGGQDAAIVFNAVAIYALVAMAGLLWFVARPGGSMKPKIAAVSAAAAAVLALVVNFVLGHLWYQSRPFVGHPGQTLLLVRHAADNSFPSDHASVAFAIAFAVIAVYRRFGIVLLVLAAAVAIDRVFVGVHYPVDVAASLLIGLGSALIIGVVCRDWVHWVVEQLSRLSDPVVGLVRGTVSRDA